MSRCLQTILPTTDNIWHTYPMTITVFLCTIWMLHTVRFICSFQLYDLPSDLYFVCLLPQVVHSQILLCHVCWTVTALSLHAIFATGLEMAALSAVKNVRYSNDYKNQTVNIRVEVGTHTLMTTVWPWSSGNWIYSEPSLPAAADGIERLWQKMKHKDRAKCIVVSLSCLKKMF